MLYTRLPTEQEAASAGFAVADYEEEAEVWPENWLAFSIFDQMGTQWKAGFNGLTGLDYQTLFILMDRRGLSGDEWWEVFADIREMEAAALKAMHPG